MDSTVSSRILSTLTRLRQIEEKMDEIIEGKKGLVEQIVGAGEEWLTELSTGELGELFALQDGALSQEPL